MKTNLSLRKASIGHPIGNISDNPIDKKEEPEIPFNRFQAFEDEPDRYDERKNYENYEDEDEEEEGKNDEDEDEDRDFDWDDEDEEEDDWESDYLDQVIWGGEDDWSYDDEMEWVDE